MNPCLSLFLALAGTCIAATPCLADEALRLDQALARSLERAPLLAARAAELLSEESRARLDALPSPYYLAADLENVGGTGALSGVDSAEITVRLGKSLELGGKVAARQKLGEAQVELQRHELTSAQSEVRDRTARRFVEVLADQQRLQLAREFVSLAERTRQEVARFVEAARNPDSDARNAEIALADAELELEHAEHELQSARVTLAAAWGAQQPDFESVQGDLTTLPETGQLDALLSGLTHAPSIQRRSLEQGAAVARRQLATASRRPDVNVSIGVRRLEAFQDHGLVLGASMPLGNTTRSTLANAASDAGIEAARYLHAGDLAELHQLVFEKFQEKQHARTEFEALRARMIPRAESALATTQLGFDRGRLPLVTLLQSQQLLFELRRRQIDAGARYHTFVLDLRLLTGAQETQP